MQQQRAIQDVNSIERFYNYVTTGICRNLVHGAAQGFVLAGLVSGVYTTLTDPAETMNVEYSRFVTGSVLFATTAGAIIGGVSEYLTDRLELTR